MKTVILKNGAEETETSVITTLINLKMLREKNAIVFYELTTKARNNKHNLFENSRKILKELHLMNENGIIYNSVKNIILSAVTGESIFMEIQNPIVNK
jgi:hypothetical protein